MTYPSGWISNPTFDGEITINELVGYVKNKNHLIQKPKIFIIEACRGTEAMTGVELISSGKTPTIPKYWPVEADILFAYATTGPVLSSLE